MPWRARQPTAALLLRAFGIRADHGWAYEGIGLYLTELLTGTHTTYTIQPSVYARDDRRTKEDLFQRIREPDADWRIAAHQRIDRLRKGDLVVEVKGAGGQPVVGAKVRATMRRHAFRFGSAVAAEELLGPAPDNRHYRDAFERLFNCAVFENDTKWPQTYRGVPSRVDEAHAWLKERQIAVRGHCLVWPSWRWLPKDLKAFADDPDELRRHADPDVAAPRQLFLEAGVVRVGVDPAADVVPLDDDGAAERFGVGRAADEGAWRCA